MEIKIKLLLFILTMKLILPVRSIMDDDLRVKFGLLSQWTGDVILSEKVVVAMIPLEIQDIFTLIDNHTDTYNKALQLVNIDRVHKEEFSKEIWQSGKESTWKIAHRVCEETIDLLQTAEYPFQDIVHSFKTFLKSRKIYQDMQDSQDRQHFMVKRNPLIALKLLAPLARLAMRALFPKIVSKVAKTVFHKGIGETPSILAEKQNSFLKLATKIIPAIGISGILLAIITKAILFKNNDWHADRIARQQERLTEFISQIVYMRERILLDRQAIIHKIQQIHKSMLDAVKRIIPEYYSIV